MKKAVFKVGVDDDKVENKVLKTVAGLPGVDTITVDKKNNKLTVIGDIDQLSILKKLRKLCHAEILSVGPENEPEKKDDDKKKKDDEKKRKLGCFLWVRKKDHEKKRKPKCFSTVHLQLSNNTLIPNTR